MVKDENGRDSYKIPEDKTKELTTKMEKISKKYTDAISAQKESNDKFIEELNSDLDFDLIKIDESFIPKNITTKQLKIVYNMINWE